MFWRMARGALFRQKGKMLMVAFTIALGASLATAMLNVMLDAGDKVNQELKAYGANINVLPRGASLLDDLYGVNEGSGVSDKYLNEAELGNIKTIFWAFNIVDFTPYLNARAALILPGVEDSPEVKLAGAWFNHHLELPTGESLDTGMRNLKSWWDVRGRWLNDDDTGAVMAGEAAARRYGLKLGDEVFFQTKNSLSPVKFKVEGIFSAGGDDDDYFYLPLAGAQNLADKAGLVSRVEVSALTTPDNELSRRAAQDPKTLSIKEWETWYCTAYVSAICYQIDEVITDAVSKPVRQVAESEGAILEKTRLLMLLITILSLAGSALGISNLVTASVMERSAEIGLLKAVGARDSAVTLLVLAEILITGIAGGTAGYFAGLGFAQIIGHSVFGSAIDIKPMVIPLVAALVFLVTMAGSVPSIRLLLSLRPAEVLHGR
ncbi:MAG: ABC transporter permease [Spirochaetaceae bacterium]|jgi:putative ABC transport system permease protein|nr:ABC transporter permease [Spirochaetaceae bacterium]